MAPPHNMKPSHFLLFPASRFSFVLRNPFLETPQNASKGTGIVCAPLFLLAKAAHSLLVPGVQPPQLRSIQRLQLHVQALVCPVDTVCPWVSRSLHVPEPPLEDRPCAHMLAPSETHIPPYVTEEGTQLPLDRCLVLAGPVLSKLTCQHSISSVACWGVRVLWEEPRLAQAFGDNTWSLAVHMGGPTLAPQAV